MRTLFREIVVVYVAYYVATHAAYCGSEEESKERCVEEKGYCGWWWYCCEKEEKVDRVQRDETTTASSAFGEAKIKGNEESTREKETSPFGIENTAIPDVGKASGCEVLIEQIIELSADCQHFCW